MTISARICCFCRNTRGLSSLVSAETWNWSYWAASCCKHHCLLWGRCACSSRWISEPTVMIEWWSWALWARFPRKCRPYSARHSESWKQKSSKRPQGSCWGAVSTEWRIGWRPTAKQRFSHSSSGAWLSQRILWSTSSESAADLNNGILTYFEETQNEQQSSESESI